jgi:hypothetical protein
MYLRYLIIKNLINNNNYPVVFVCNKLIYYGAGFAYGQESQYIIGRNKSDF